MGIVLDMAVTIEVALTFRLPLGVPFGLLLVFILQPAVDSIGRTVRVDELNNRSSSSLEFNTFCYFRTFAQLDKEVNGTILRILDVFCQESPGTFCQACQQGIKESGIT